MDMELLFARHASQLSEIFWEGNEQFLHTRRGILMESMSSKFISRNAATYAGPVVQAGGAMDNSVGFIDGTVICIAPPGD